MGELDPRHAEKRQTMTGLGGILLLIGIPCALIGVVMFLSVFFTSSREFFDNPHETMDSSARRGVIGMILIAVGGVSSSIGMSLLGFAQSGRIMRYQAGESMPVMKDSLRDATPVIGETVRSIAGALREGVGGHVGTSKVQHSCGAWNDPGDEFCKSCGQPIGQPTCAKCGTKNDADARFCDRCGAALQS